MVNNFNCSEGVTMKGLVILGVFSANKYSIFL